MLRELSYVQAIGEALTQAMELDNHVFLMGEGVDNVTGVYGTVLSVYSKFGSGRVIDTPLSENGLTGFAIGAALGGMRPVLFHQRNDFMLLTMDQLINHAAKINFMSGGKQRVPMTVVSFIARKIGEGAQHSQSLQAFFAHAPGLNVVMPTTPSDAKQLLLGAIFNNEPTVVLYHRDLFEERGTVDNVPHCLKPGFARVVKTGEDITVVAVSATIKDAIQASEALSGISTEIIDLRSVRPLDEKTIIDSVKKTGRLLVVDTAWKSFGISAEIVSIVAENATAFLKSPPRRIGMKETPAPASPYLLENYHPTASMIITAVKEMMSNKL